MADLIVRFLGESSGLTSEIEKLKGHLSQASGSFSGFSKVAGIAGLALGGVLVGGLIESVKAAEQGEASQAALNAAVKATGQSVQKTADALDAAQSSARSYGFSNEDARTALAKLEIATGSTSKATSDLSAVMDLARFKHEDLATAAQTVARSMSGSTRAASQLGIAIVPVTTHLDALKAAYGGVTKNIPPAALAQAKLEDKMATGAKAVALMSEKLKGQAAAYRDTAAGGMAVFHAQLENLEESVGKVFIPILAQGTGLLAEFGDWMSKNTGTVKIALVALTALAGILMAVGVATRVWAAIQAVWAAGQAVVTAATWLWNAALDANPIGLVVLAIAGLVAALIYAYTHFTTFRDIVNGAFDVVKTIVLGFVSFFITTLPNAFMTVLNWLRGNWPMILTIISGPFAPLVALATNSFGFRTALVNAFQAVLGYLQGLGASIVAVFAGAGTWLYNAGQQVLQGFINGIKSAIGGVISTISGAASSAISAAKGILHINSPSLVFHEIGLGVMEGFANGIAAGTGPTVAQMGASAGGVINAGAVAAPMAAGAGGGGASITINVSGSVLSENDLIETVRQGLIRVGKRNGQALGGFA